MECDSLNQSFTKVWFTNFSNFS